MTVKYKVSAGIPLKHLKSEEERVMHNLEILINNIKNSLLILNLKDVEINYSGSALLSNTKPELYIEIKDAQTLLLSRMITIVFGSSKKTSDAESRLKLYRSLKDILIKQFNITLLSLDEFKE